MCRVESVSGETISTAQLNEEQDDDIRSFMAKDLYDPETYAHNCAPVDIIYKKGKNGRTEKYFKT